MKTNLVLSLLVSGLLSTGFISSNANAGFFTPNKPTQTSEDARAQRDGEIIAILIGLNENEIAAAKEASKKSHNPSVKKYARMIKQDHSKNLRDTIRLSKKIGIAPVQTQAVVMLKKDGEQEMLVLAPLNAKEFDRAFVNAMIHDHSQAIEMMDSNLLKNVTNQKLKHQLEVTRPKLEAHLNKAKSIQHNLG